MALSETADELQSDGSAMCPVKIADELFEICLWIEAEQTV